MEDELPLLEEGSCVDRECHVGEQGRPGARAQQGDLLELTQRREPRRSSHVSKVWRLETGSHQGGDSEGRPHLETAASFPCFPSQVSWHHCKFIHSITFFLFWSIITFGVYMQAKKQQLELDMEKQTGLKLEKEYVKAVYRHPAYLTCMQSNSA